MPDWLILTATLPTKPSALRVRVWRALKATGAGTLREGVYLLPAQAPAAQALQALERTITEAGAEAHLLAVAARDEAQDAAFRAHFDRSGQYAGLMAAVQALRSTLAQATESTLRKRLQALEQQFQAIRASDFFPGPAQDEAADALAALRRAATLHWSPGEPAAASAAVQRRSAADFQGRTWATRRRPWVDRLATAWLVQRFVDRAPRFTWLEDARACPATAIGYDFDGASFTHVGDQVTFEVVASSFSLDADAALGHLGQLVRCIDTGGTAVDEAPGVELLVRGLQRQHGDDDALLAAALPLFDTLYAALQARPA